MVAEKWLWSTVSKVLEQDSPVSQAETSHHKDCARTKHKAQREWQGAIAALENLLRQTFSQSPCSHHNQGLILSGPSPVLTNSEILSQMHRGLFIPDAFNPLALMPEGGENPQPPESSPNSNPVAEIPVLLADPLAQEQFCLVLTPGFALAMALGENSSGEKSFQFSFSPEIIQQVWQVLRSRIFFTSHHYLQYLESLIDEFAPPVPDYRIVTHFSRQLLHYLPNEPTIVDTRSVSCSVKVGIHGKVNQGFQRATQSDSQVNQPIFASGSNLNGTKDSRTEIELLQALTHEIRTPLTTIRMLTRSLMRKCKQLNPDIIKRLETIDQECTEQINRMELIFKAVELEATAWKQKGVQLCAVPLEQWFEQSISRWQKQAKRRNVNLDVKLPEHLPTVVSNPAMLDQVLTGLIENFTRKLPTGSQVQVQVTRAGSQLKLQFVSEAKCHSNPFKSLGHLLIFQPETGSLSLNLDVTKNLFQAMGGKLTVRQRHKHGEVFTVFLPLGSQSEVKL